MRELSHGRCAKRVCCESWSCDPHLADCETVEHRRFLVPAGVSLAEFKDAVPIVHYPRRSRGPR